MHKALCYLSSPGSTYLVLTIRYEKRGDGNVNINVTSINVYSFPSICKISMCQNDSMVGKICCLIFHLFLFAFIWLLEKFKSYVEAGEIGWQTEFVCFVGRRLSNQYSIAKLNPSTKLGAAPKTQTVRHTHEHTHSNIVGIIVGQYFVNFCLLQLSFIKKLSKSREIVHGEQCLSSIINSLAYLWPLPGMPRQQKSLKSEMKLSRAWNTMGPIQIEHLKNVRIFNLHLKCKEFPKSWGWRDIVQ